MFKPGHCSPTSNLAGCHLNSNGTILKLHDKCPRAKFNCGKQVTFTPKQREYESKGFEKELKKILKGLKKHRIKFSVIVPASFIGMAVRVFQKLFKLNNILHYSRFTDHGLSIAERFIQTIPSWLKKQVFHSGQSDWLTEVPCVNKKPNSTTHFSTKMTPVQAFDKSKWKNSIFQSPRHKQKNLQQTITYEIFLELQIIE